MSADYVKLGQNVKKYRRMANLTQEQLAEKSGYTNSHIGQIENAHGIPSFDAVVSIADALDVTMDQLVYGSMKNSDGYFVQEMLRLTNGFDRKQKDFVIDMIVALCEQMKKHFEEDDKQ